MGVSWFSVLLDPWDKGSVTLLKTISVCCSDNNANKAHDLTCLPFHQISDLYQLKEEKRDKMHRCISRTCISCIRQLMPMSRFFLISSGLCFRNNSAKKDVMLNTFKSRTIVSAKFQIFMGLLDSIFFSKKGHISSTERFK